VSDPRLGWWVQLVECSAFDSDVRAAVLDNWGRELSGSSICTIDWPDGYPIPNQLTMYGTAEDIQPNFDEMACAVKEFMDATQYFAFIFMKDTVLATGGLECVVFSKNTMLRVNGRVMIQHTIEKALNIELTLNKDLRDAADAVGG